MEYYICRNGKPLHFFRLKTGELSVRHTVIECIYRNSGENFCVYSNSNGINLVCVSSENELVYMLLNENQKKECKLCRLNENIAIKHIFLSEANNMMSLYFSVGYKGEALLVRCALDANSKPEVIATLKSYNFFVFDNRIYHTQKNGTLGYCDFSPDRPRDFMPVEENAEDAFVFSDGESKYFLFRKGDEIFVNGERKIKDVGASLPIIAKRDDKLLLMWQSGAVVKYTDLNNTSKINKIISNGKQAPVYIQKDGIFYDYAPITEFA